MNVLLVRKIQLIAIKFQFLIHLPHIDGTHMIHYSVDGMSCGEIILGNLQTPVEELIISTVILLNVLPVFQPGCLPAL